MVCSDTNDDGCNIGDTMPITGTVTIKNDLSSEEVYLDAWATFMGFDIYDVITEEVDICNYVSSANDDSSCPSAGTYYFTQSFTIPEEMDNFSSFMNMLGIALYATDEDGNRLGCWKASMSVSSSSNSSYSSAMIAFTGIIGI